MAFMNIEKKKELGRTYKESVNYADSYAIALNKMRNEKDPIKRQKMNIRLASGITDFTDL